jgi:hypothetical protein
MLNPTPADEWCDELGRLLCFANVENLSTWTPEQFRAALRNVHPGVRCHALAKLMEQAKPDDVLSWVDPRQLEEDWQEVQVFLAKRWEFWSWVIERLGEHRRAAA